MRRTPLRTYAPLKRGKPLARRTRLKPRRATPRRSSRARDREYLARIRELPCLMAGLGLGRHTPVEAHHASVDHGLGAKGSDYAAVPLCRTCHRQWTDHAGFFQGLTKEQRRNIAATWIHQTQQTTGLTADPNTKEQGA